ncbi:MAG: hypothetical protein ACKOAF_02795 [Actinomycetes bacterium]
MATDAWAQDDFESATSDHWGAALRAPVFPVLVAMGLLVVSVLLNIPGSGSRGVSELIIGIVGYLITPIGTALTLVWAMRIHNQYTAKDLYDSSTGQRLVKYCSVIAILGFVAGLVHILHIANWFAILLAPGTSS